MADGASDTRPSFRAVLRIPAFRALWLADLQSLFGDQLARVALAIVVYERTRSTLASASVFSLTFLPTLVGGVLLSGLADRVSRRLLMISIDLARMALIGLMAVPAIPISLLLVLLSLSVLIGAPFSAAQSAALPEILGLGELYLTAIGLRAASDQVAVLLGWAIGGAAVQVIGARATLLIDAATYAVSAVLVGRALLGAPGGRPESAQSTGPSNGRSPLGFLRSTTFAAAALISRDRTLVTLLGFCWIIGLYVVPEALAVPYATSSSMSLTSVGLLLAATPAGLAIGNLAFTRFVPGERRARLIGVFAAASGLCLAPCVFRPPLPIVLLLWCLAGIFQCYLFVATATFSLAIPGHIRGSAIGLASSSLLVAQGLGPLFGGVLAEWTSASTSIALCGLAGAAIAGLLAIGWKRIQDQARYPRA